MRFEEADYDLTAGAFMKADVADQRLMVQFSHHPHLDQQASTDAGRPIYKDRVYVLIMVPGDKDSIVHRPAWDLDYRRFPAQYTAFKNKASEAVIGTPLKLVPWLTASQVRELDYFNVRTVEQLAEVSDGLAPNFMGLHGLKQQARDFVRAATEAAPFAKMSAELQQRDDQIAAMQAQLEALASRVEKSEAPKPEKVPAKEK